MSTEIVRVDFASGPAKSADRSLAGKSVVVIGALPESLLNFRGDLIRDLIAAGARVTAMSAPADASVVDGLAALGCTHRPFPVTRTGMNPRADLETLRVLRRCLRELRPDHVIAYTIKPVVYGGLAHRLAGVDGRFHGLVTGLGIAFAGSSIRGRLLGHGVGWLFRRALARAATVFFQNPDDRDVFVRRGLVDPRHTVLLNGTGLDVGRFEAQPLPDGPPRFLMIARLLRSKGVLEYAEAARLVRERHPDWTFDLLGPPDNSPDAVTPAELERIAAAGHINLLGAAHDVRPFIARCHVFVLPSYYPEGRPRTIQEALAIGRPVITTDMPGCRDAIEPGVSGWLVPPRDARGLADRLLALEEVWPKLASHAEAARALALSRYDVRLINQRIIEALVQPA